MSNISTTNSATLIVKNRNSIKKEFNQSKTLNSPVKRFQGSSSITVAMGIYDCNNIDYLPWPNTDAGQFAKRYLYPFVKKGSRHFIENVNAEIRVLQIDDHVLPLVIVDNNYDNSYICSPYAHYVSLALDKLHLFKRPFIKKAATFTLKILGKILRKGKINQVVYVNHWLLSTDLHPQNLSKKDVEKISSYLQEQFPNSAIAFRSINKKNCPQLKKDIKKCGFKLIVSRQVYLTDTTEKSLYTTRIIKSDLKLWRESGYEIVEGHQLSECEKKRVMELYNIHSIFNHSSLNPQFNHQFLEMMLKQQLLHIKALRRNGVIDGVVGYQIKNGVFFCPFFGYDKSQGDQTRLYRLLSTMLLLEATKEKKLFHQSAGASFYKKIRRAVGFTEYLAVYYRHLSIRQRLAWKIVKTVMNIAAVPLIKKY